MRWSSVLTHVVHFTLFDSFILLLYILFYSAYNIIFTLPPIEEYILFQGLKHTTRIFLEFDFFSYSFVKLHCGKLNFSIINSSYHHLNFKLQSSK